MSTCVDCGAPSRFSLGDVQLCDRCFDLRVAKETGYPPLPAPPPPLTVAGADGRRHTLNFRVWRAPTGVVVELEEEGFPPGEGYQFSVLGAHDASVDALVERVAQQATQGIGRQYLEPNPSRRGWLVREEEVAGRLVFSGHDRPHDVIVDGRTLTWQELGRALEPFEGHRFRIIVEDPSDDARPDAQVITGRFPDASAPHQESPSPTIAEVFAEFLAEQQARLAAKTFGNYAAIIDLFATCLNGYGHQYLDDDEAVRLHKAFEAGDEEAFVRLFGPDKIPAALGEFLDYFMIRKVMASEDLLKAAGTVTKRLAKWLGEHGYIDHDQAAIAADRGAKASRDLPKAERLSNILWDFAEATDADTGGVADEDIIDDYLVIDRVEPGLLWFEGGIGPVAVPAAATAIAKPGWSVNIVLARVGKAWRVIEVGNVYP